MKHQNSRQPVDEREKLRKFRELDDAFAEALRELEAPGGASADAEPAPTSAKRRQPASAVPQDEPTRQRLFEERLRALMNEYAQPADNVSRLLETLRSLGRIA